MRSLRVIELVLGWLAVILGAALLAFLNSGEIVFADAESAQRDTIGLSLLLLVLAVGVTLDVLYSSRASLILLAVGAFAMIVVGVVSFIILLLLPASLAVATAIIGFARSSAGSPALP